LTGRLLKGDCLELMEGMPDKSVDSIITDPPYLYLKHKLDRPFDEKKVFSEWDRIVKDDGFLVFFGRGGSFHRWNYLLNEMGWEFKEEIVWDKKITTSPFLPIGRKHETISVLSKKGKMRQHKIPYLDIRKYDPERMQNDFKRIVSSVKQPEKLKAIDEFLKTNQLPLNQAHTMKHGITVTKFKESPREITGLNGIVNGMKEQSIIVEQAPHYKMQHPTQKPVRLMERLILCVTDENQTVLDPFMGSGSTGVACVNTNRNFIGMELDDEYFKIAQERVNEAVGKEKQMSLF